MYSCISEHSELTSQWLCTHACDNLAKHITLGNIYRPPKCNNNDQVLSTFINELAPVITKLGKECSETIIVGDFNIDLLKVGERQKYAEYLDLFQTNSFYPKLILPTRFSSKSCTLIDQISVRRQTQLDLQAQILLLVIYQIICHII